MIHGAAIDKRRQVGHLEAVPDRLPV